MRDDFVFRRLGGSECLDYISIYHNPGNESSSAHWHYVTFGLSDLHGDGRVHKYILEYFK